MSQQHDLCPKNIDQLVVLKVIIRYEKLKRNIDPKMYEPQHESACLDDLH